MMWSSYRERFVVPSHRQRVLIDHLKLDRTLLGGGWVMSLVRVIYLWFIVIFEVEFFRVVF